METLLVIGLVRHQPQSFTPILRLWDSIFLKERSLHLSKLKFSVEGLDEWIGISGICTETNHYEEKCISIHFRHPRGNRA